jgi:ABC-type transport system involved in cytochrome c biogenesis permease subunit
MRHDWPTTIVLGVIALIGMMSFVAASGRLRRGGSSGRGRAERWMALAIAALAGAGIGYRVIAAPGRWQPLGTHADGLLLLIGLLALVLAHLQWVGRLRGVELFGLPVIVLMGLWGICATWWTFAAYDIRGLWDGLHITAAYLAIGAGALAAVSGGAYLHVQRLLRRSADPAGRIRVLGQMGSLESIEHWMMAWATAAFVLITLVLVVGAIDATTRPTALGRSWWAQPKVIAGGAVWLVLAAACHVRLAPRFRGARAAMLAVAGFVMMLVVLAMAISMAR